MELFIVAIISAAVTLVAANYAIIGFGYRIHKQSEIEKNNIDFLNSMAEINTKHQEEKQIALAISHQKIQKEVDEQLEIKEGTTTYLTLLINDSQEQDFESRHPTREDVIKYYNSSLVYLITKGVILK